MSSSRRDLIYRMTADPAGFKRGLEEAGKSTRGFDRELRKLEQQQARVDSAMTSVGTGMLTAGAAIAVGLGLTVKAAIDWETAWTGVLKTVDGTPEQMAALEQSLRDLTGVLPATHEEIAGVAEAAGQLGIKRGDIVAFTRTMIDLGETTNLSAQDASIALARFMNIMGTSTSDVDKLGSAIVDLGNNSATTEAEIVEMAMRIAGAGKTIGLSESDVLAFAAALSSAGVEAEAGGTAISRVFATIDQAVREGGDALEQFAAVAGMSSADFTTAYRDDAAGAIDAFVVGLGRAQNAGDNVFATLTDLGLGEMRVRDSLLRLANSSDLLTKSLGTSNTAWDENKALMEEAEKRYGTTEAQMAIARNRVVDFAISMGEVLLPIIGEVASFLGGLADVLGSLPGPIQTLLVVVASLAAVIGIVGGAALIAVPKIHAFNLALAQMSGPVAGAARAGLSKLSNILMGPVGIALAGVTIGLGVWAAAEAAAEAEVDELTATLDEQTGAITDNTRAFIANKLQEEGAFESAKKLGISQSELVDAVLNGTDAMAEQRERLAELKKEAAETGGEFATLSTEEQENSARVAALDRIMADLGETFGEAQAESENMREAMKDNKEETIELTGAEQQLAESLGLTSEQAREGSDALNDLDQAIQALLDHAFGLVQAEDALQEQIKKTTDAAKENGGALKGNSEAARENRRNMEDLTGSIADMATETFEATLSNEAATEVIDDQIQSLRDNAEEMGLTAAEVEEYIDVLEDLKGTYPVNVITNYTTKGTPPWRPGGGAIPTYQTGGLVTGGPPGVDAGFARLTNNEFVVRESATRRHLPLLQAINAGADPALGNAGGRSFHIENLNMQAWSDHFDAKQVEDNLAWHLAFSGAT
jgi:TP901 family phage tail tape measure protein